MSKELPAPVTKNSSKADLWRELQCALAELNSIHGQNKALAAGQKQMLDEIAVWKGAATACQWQIDMVLQVLGRRFVPHLGETK